MLGNLIAPEIEELIAARDFGSLRDLLSGWGAPELAELISEIAPEGQAVVFRILPRDLASESFEYLPIESQESLLKALGQDQVAAILNGMSADDRTALLEELPAAATKKLLELLTPQERAVAQRLLGYPEYSIGRLMTPEYIAVREEWTIAEVLEYIRRYGRDSETLNVIYVVDDAGRLVDDIRTREALLSSPEKRVADLMDRKFVALSATDPQENAVKTFADYDRTALPVTDSQGKLLGIVTVDDVLDVAQAEATEDIQKLGGVEALDEPYLETPLPRMIKKRAGWLVILFISQMATVTAMTFLQHRLESILTMLIIFVPLIISSGGNSGGQASSLVIRAIALGELTLKDWSRVFRRELITSAALGVFLGGLGALRIVIGAQLGENYGGRALLVGVTLFVTVVGIVVWGSLVGSTLPLLLKRLGLDPATSSAPFVATLVDVTGILIYMGVAVAVLGGVG